MKVLLKRLLITTLAFYLLPFTFYLSFAQDIKSPNVAGTFYPDNPAELSQLIESFLNAAKPLPIEGNIFALIAPHAGYGFSGATAAYAYKLIQGKSYKTVVVIGPSHYYGFKGVSVYPEGIFRTPLGDLEIDKEFTQQLLGKDPEISFDALAFQKEHSVEVQLPFLQKVLPNFSAFGGKIVPIVMGDCTFSTCQKLANLLKDACAGRSDILFIASSDMYHGYDYEEAQIIDNLTLSYLSKMDGALLYQKLEDGTAQLCGGMPVVTTLLLAKERGHNKLKVLNYTNSAIVIGKKIKGIWTVGYGSCVIDREKGEVEMLKSQQRKKLLAIARKSITTYLETGKKLELTETDPLLLKEMGAFVTLRKHGELRGCIGNLIGNQPLYLTIRNMAVEAAVGDPRFSPVTASELKDIEIEVSVLSPLKKISSPDEIQLGRDGVLIKRGFNSGVYLPQVATETGWSKEEFLSSLCAHKAGLPADTWRDKATEIYIFSAEVFSEKDK